MSVPWASRQDHAINNKEKVLSMTTLSMNGEGFFQLLLVAFSRGSVYSQTVPDHLNGPQRSTKI